MAAVFSSMAPARILSDKKKVVNNIFRAAALESPPRAKPRSFIRCLHFKTLVDKETKRPISEEGVLTFVRGAGEEEGQKKSNKHLKAKTRDEKELNPGVSGAFMLLMFVIS